MKRAAIIVASGKSQRMGFDKLAATLAGERVLVRSVRAFLALPDLHQLIVVTNDERFSWLAELQGPIQHVSGGAERSDSVAQGLAALAEDVDLVAIHDGARPLIRPSEIESCFQEAAKTGAAALARRVTETLKRADEEKNTIESISRDHLWLMETPQVFRRDLIQNAYQAVLQRGEKVTDEVSALQLIGIQTKLVENSSPNPKITLPSDLPLADYWLTNSCSKPPALNL